MIIDCFIFRDEIDILKLRVNELKNKVDKFIMVSSSRTHLTGEPQEQFFTDESLSEFCIEHGIEGKLYWFISDLSGIETKWGRENGSRITIGAILSQCQDIPNDALIMVSDVDEIPNVDTVLKDGIDKLQHNAYVSLNQLYFVYYAEIFSGKAVTGTVICRFEDFIKLYKMDQRATQILRDKKDFLPVIDNGGWHMSYFGGPTQLCKKATTIAEGATTYTKQFFDDQIVEAISHQKCPYSEWPLQFLKMDNQNQYLSYWNLRFTGKTQDNKVWKAVPDEIYNHPEKHEALLLFDNSGRLKFYE